MSYLLKSVIAGDLLLDKETGETCEILNITKEYMSVCYEGRQGSPIFIYYHDQNLWLDYFTPLEDA